MKRPASSRRCAWSGEASDRLIEVAIPSIDRIGLMGLLIIALPFTTPETSALFGLRRSIGIARVLGALTLISGAWIVIAG